MNNKPIPQNEEMAEIAEDLFDDEPGLMTDDEYEMIYGEPR